MLKYWIWLSTREGVSNVQALSLLSRLGSAAAIYQADEDALKDADGRPVPTSLLDKSLTGAEIILQQCYQKNIHVMTIQDAQYPARLRVISDPPIVLYYKGVFPAIDTSPVIAMVGTRKASAYGLMQAKRLGYQVAKSGGIVVSGGADGIDTMCLTGALTLYIRLETGCCLRISRRTGALSANTRRKHPRSALISRSETGLSARFLSAWSL